MSYLTDKIDKFIAKGIIYLKPGEHSPEGIPEQHGKRGGRYYVGSGKGGTAEAEEQSQRAAPEQQAAPNEHFSAWVAGGEQVFLGPRGSKYYLLDPEMRTNSYFACDVRINPEYRSKILRDWGELFQNIVNKMPAWVIDGLKVIASVDMYNELAKEEQTGSVLGTYWHDQDIIDINPLLVGLDEEKLLSFMEEEYDNELSCHPFSAVLAHEIGHRVLGMLQAEDEGANTVFVGDLITITYPANRGVVTQYAKKNKAERFAEAFLYYVQNPRILRGRDPTSYEFIKEHVFDGQEFDEPLFKQADGEELPRGSAWIEEGIDIEKIFGPAEEKNAEPPFVRWRPDEGLVQKSQPQEDPLENPEYGYGNAVGSMTVAKEISNENQNGKQKSSK